MMNIQWIIDVDMLSETQKVPQSLRNLGYDCVEVTDNYRIKTQAESLVWGSHQFIRKLKRINPDLNLVTYGLGNNVRRSTYTSYIPLDWFLNADSVMTTWANFKNNKEFFYSIFDKGEGVFIRPDSGFKTFTGQVITHDEFDYEINSLDQISSVIPDTFIWVTTAKKFRGEHRFWVCNKEIITSSPYSWDNGPVFTIADSEVELVEKVACHSWQLDTCYVVDTTVDDEYQAKIVEFNSFSSSGLYQCEYEKLFKTVTDTWIKELLHEN